MSKFYYEMTSYPRIFKNTYWGDFKVHDDDEYLSEIFKNRNEFVEKYGIIKLANCPNFGNYQINGEREFDHVELYKTNHDFVLITSPYVGEIGSERDDFLTVEFCKLGFEVLPPLYPYAKTFMKRFAKMMDVKKFANRA